MSYVPTTMATLRDELQKVTGLSLISLGVVGNTAHRSGYHLGRDRIFSSTGKGWNDYSVVTARDKAGLSNGAMAIDIGNFGIAKLRAMSVWLVKQAQKNAPGTRDIREIIYSPDGKVVLRYDRQRGFASAPKPGEADSSHLTHTHISFYRDSENREKWPIFAPFFGASPSTEEIVKSFGVYEVPRLATPREDPTRPGNSVWLYTTSDLKADGNEVSLKPLRPLALIAPNIIPGVAAVAYEPAVPDADATSRVYFCKTTDLTNIVPVPLPAPPPDPTKLAEAKTAGFREAKSKASLAVNNITEG